MTRRLTDEARAWLADEGHLGRASAGIDSRVIEALDAAELRARLAGRDAIGLDDIRDAFANAE